jgi:nitroreductase
MALDIIKNRWSPVSFSHEPVEDYKLKEILGAAGYAPSSMNEQPWIFIITTKEYPDKFNDFIGFLDESNQVWAKNAYALIISLARMNFKFKNRINKYAFYDTGQAVNNMVIQAQSMNVFVHQMGGYSTEKVKQYFNLPDGIEPVTVMALGYRGDGSNLPEELKKRDANRKSKKNISDFVFRNGLDEPAY